LEDGVLSRRSVLKMSSSSREGQPPLVDRILQTGKQAFDPDLPEENRAQRQRNFKELLDRYRRVRINEGYAKVL
jgi:hypothetical protein